MSHYVFEEIHTYRKQSGACPICGRRTSRSKRFTCTVNPYNRNSDGVPRTVSEVCEQVEQIADRWEPDFTHAKCKDRS